MAVLGSGRTKKEKRGKCDDELKQIFCACGTKMKEKEVRNDLNTIK